MNQVSKARERILRLVDEGSFVEIGARVSARATDFCLQEKASSGDGVVTGYATAAGKLVYIYSQDESVLGGSMGEMHADKIARIYELAKKTGAPVIGLLSCSGVRLKESVDALQGFGRLYLAQAEASGMVPQITAVYGNCGGGLAIAAGLSDFVFIEEKGGRLFVNAPNTQDGNTVEACDTASAAYQAENSGIVDDIGTEDEIADRIRELIDLLPSNNDDTAVQDSEDDLNRLTESLEGVEDVRAIISTVADSYRFFETKKAFGTDMVTGFIRLDGITVGVVGNAEERMSAYGMKKAASFVNFCDAFEIPVLTFTNTVGFDTAVDSGKRLAKAAADLLYAYANATVPKINVIVGRAYASAYVLMNSKAVGADYVYAVEDARIGVMDASMAAKILGGGNLTETAAAFDEKQTAEASAKRGYVDELVTMTALRKHILVALEMLFNKRADAPYKKHGTK
ncbi:MAG: carboxyl transferase [Lachnospiraceae bacterium]|nr:carboxyl transferase [Lachnospiraceae bacterium]